MKTRHAAIEVPWPEREKQFAIVEKPADDGKCWGYIRISVRFTDAPLASKLFPDERQRSWLAVLRGLRYFGGLREVPNSSRSEVRDSLVSLSRHRLTTFP